MWNGKPLFIAEDKIWDEEDGKWKNQWAEAKVLYTEADIEGWVTGDNFIARPIGDTADMNKKEYAEYLKAVAEEKAAVEALVEHGEPGKSGG